MLLVIKNSCRVLKLTKRFKQCELRHKNGIIYKKIKILEKKLYVSRSVVYSKYIITFLTYI